MPELKYDPQNANRGTDRGRALLKESIETAGFGRSILIDKHGVAIAGNKTLEAASALETPVQTVETTGHELVVVQRTDLDLRTDERARQLAYYDNRVGEVNLDWDPSRIQADALAGIDLSAGFHAEELAELVSEAATSFMPEPVAERDAAHERGNRGALPETSPMQKDPEAIPDEVPDSVPANLVRVEFGLAGVEARLRWGAFLRELKRRYADLETPGQRVMAFLAETEGL